MVFQDWRFFGFVVCAEFFTVVNMGKLENSNLLFCFTQVRVCENNNVCTFLNQSFRCGKNIHTIQKPRSWQKKCTGIDAVRMSAQKMFRCSRELHILWTTETGIWNMFRARSVLAPNFLHFFDWEVWSSGKITCGCAAWAFLLVQRHALSNNFEDLSCSAFYIQLCNAVFVEFDSTIDFNLLEKILDTGKKMISEYAQ